MVIVESIVVIYHQHSSTSNQDINIRITMPTCILRRTYCNSTNTIQYIQFPSFATRNCAWRRSKIRSFAPKPFLRSVSIASIWMVKGSFVPKLSWSLMSTTFLLRQNPHDWYHLIPILVRYLLEFRLSSSSHGSLAVLLHDHPADCSRVVPPPSALTNGEVHQPINPRYPCHCCEQVVMICLEKCNIVIWY